jgi:hypothetical protein
MRSSASSKGKAGKGVILLLLDPRITRGCPKEVRDLRQLGLCGTCKENGADRAEGRVEVEK